MLIGDDERYKQAFAKRLSQAIENEGMTQKALAIQSYFSEKAISELCKGKRKPHVSTVKRLANALNVDYKWLLWGDEYE